MELDAYSFRHAAGQVRAALADSFGPARIDAVEDAVQDALLTAVDRWRTSGVPDNPEGWLYRVARNRLTDVFRREQTEARYRDDRRAAPADDHVELQVFGDHEIADAELRMMFACCDPALTPPSQIALILKILCGLNVREIATALLTGEEAVRKRILRAKRRLAERGDLDLPRGKDLESRLGSVQQALYLLFNEGYCSHHPDGLIRRELCLDSIRLTRLLSEHTVTGVPSSWALLALLCFHLARFDSRVDDEGKMVLLDDQDRDRWDRAAMTEGFRCLERSASGERMTRFHLEAAIAAQHCLSTSVEETDWKAIVGYYEDLVALTGSPVHRLNRAVAIGQLHGASRGLRAIDELGDGSVYATYVWFYAVRAELRLSAGLRTQAAADFQAALDVAESPAERALLARKLDRCQEREG